MKLLIIGGTGFFGKSILDSFKRGRLKTFKITELIILSRSVYKFQKLYPEFKDQNIKFLEEDISKIDNIPFAEIVIYAASSSNLEKLHNKKQSIDEVKEYLTLAKKFHKNSKIVFCSSGAVYGKIPDDILNVEENFPFQDLDNLTEYKRVYALIKREAESLFKNFGNKGLNISIARCFSFQGKYLPEDGHFAYSKFLKFAKNGNDINVDSKNEVIRSYMNADDLVDSLIKVALTAKPSCPIYNVGSDIPISIFSLAQKIAKEYNVNVVTKNKIDFSKVDRYVPNTDKLKKLL